MILADTSVWIDHLRSGDEKLASVLHDGLVLIHPFVVGARLRESAGSRVSAGLSPGAAAGDCGH